MRNGVMATSIPLSFSPLFVTLPVTNVLGSWINRESWRENRDICPWRQRPNQRILTSPFRVVFCPSYEKENDVKKTGLICLLVLLLVPALFTFANGEDEGAVSGELTVWCWDPNFNGYSMKQAAAVYTAQNPDVTINVVDIPENIEAKIEAGLQAGGVGLPDISLFQDFIIEKFLQNYPGSFVDLKAEGMDYSQFAPYKVGPMSEGESTYGVPFDTGATGFFLRTEVLEAAGLTPEDFYEGMTWEEVIALGEVVKAKTGKAIIAYDNTSFDFLRIMVQSTGEQFFRADGSVNYNTPAHQKIPGHSQRNE